MAVLRRDTVIPLADYPDRDDVISLQNLPNDAVGFTLELLRCTSADPTIWPSEATKLWIRVECSLDNGKTWLGCGGVGAQGGIHVRHDGTESPMTTLTCGFPPGTNRRLRLYVQITGGPLRTEGTLELRDS